MRKIFQLTTLFVIAAGLVGSCTEPTDNGLSSFNAPTDLRTGTLTATTASLSWAFISVADGYNVIIGDGEPIMVYYPDYQAENLTAETSYTWKVQAVIGNHVSAWVDGPVFTTPKEGVTVVPPPTGLVVLGLTHNSAKLTYKYVDADAMEVSINDGEPTLGSYVYDLTPETTYSWKMRIGKNDVWSEWAQGEDFTTRKDTGNTQFLDGYVSGYYADYYGVGAEMFVLEFSKGSNAGNDIELQLNMCFSETKLGMEPGKRWLDLPNTTYTCVERESIAINKVLGWIDDDPITSGSMMVKGDYINGYNITFDITYGGGTISAEYNGRIDMPNPKYPPAGDPVDFGTLTETFTMWHMPAETFDAWLLQAHDSGVYVDETSGSIKGEGWWLMCQIHAPAGSGAPMPDGTYNINYTGKPWSVLSRGNNGMSVVEVGKRTLYVTSGTLKSTYSNGEYTIIVDTKTDNGTVVKGTVKAVNTQRPYGSPRYSLHRWRPFGGMTDAGAEAFPYIARPTDINFETVR